MPRLLLPATAVALLGLVAAWGLRDWMRAGDAVGSAPRDERGEDVAAAALVAGGAEPPSRALESRPEVERSAREALPTEPVGPAVAPAEVEAATAPIPIAGVLLDASGRGVPGARIHWMRCEDIALWRKWNRFDPSPLFDVHGATFTDASGWFELPESDARGGAALQYGFEFVEGPPLDHQVDPSIPEQILRLPAARASGPAVEIVVTERGTGRGVTPELVRVAREHATAHGARVRLPSGDAIQPRSDGLLLHPIEPGSYLVWLAGRSTTLGLARFVVPEVGPDVRVELEVEPLDAGAAWSFDLLGRSGAARPARPDVDGGFDAYLPDNRREMWDHEADRFFGHTIVEHGPGPVRGALLELHLFASWGGAENDDLWLEFREKPADAGPVFAWRSFVRDLPGVDSWEAGRTCRVVLDLGALPTADGTISLLDDLEDGKLDVMVTDDTAVLDLRLHVSY